MKQWISLEPCVEAGFSVSEKRKKVWNVELNLFEELRKVCEENHLSLFADGGTLLGAVRHKGFIPWDDDMDFVMPRPDYEKLKKIAPSAFSNPYFFQDNLTDYSFRVHAQLHDLSTTALSPDRYRARYARGIFIDIFPLDAYSFEWKDGKDTLEELKHLREKYQRLLFYHYITGQPVKRLAKNVLFTLYRPLLRASYRKGKTYQEFEDHLLSNFETRSFEYLWDFTLDYPMRKTWMKKEDYASAVALPFENTTIPCPVGYDDILRRNFGDYWTPVQGTSIHGELLFDTERPYTDYDRLGRKAFLEAYEKASL